MAARRVAVLPRVTLDLFASGPRSLAARHANIFAPIARAALLLGWLLLSNVSNLPDAPSEQRRLPYMLLLTTAVLRAAEYLLLTAARRAVARSNPATPHAKPLIEMN